MDNKKLQTIVEANKKGYIVNEFGEVYSLNGRKRKLRRNTRGYLSFNIRISNGKTFGVLVHRLQAYQKYGDAIFTADCVRHFDGNKENNRYENIGIGTTMDNWMDIPEKMRHEICATANQKYSINTVKEIRIKHNAGIPMKKLMEEYKITSKGTFSYILNKRMVDY